MNYIEAKEKLASIGQQHILKYYEELTEEEQKALLHKIEITDFSVLTKDAVKSKDEIAPIDTLTLEQIEEELKEDETLGLEALASGKLACILLAGGMGSRLGSENPKGMYNVGISRELSIFQCQINTLKEVVRKCGKYIYLFIMTSPLNHEATVNYFKEKEYFGYKESYIKFFIQDEYPVTDEEGKVLMANPYTFATAANGNGGWFISMQSAGLVDFSKEKGIEYFNVYAVDNVLQKMADPVFLGACIKRNVECGAKVVRKADPSEKVGVICLANGHPSITEYIELTDELRYSKNAKGEYLYNFGVILNYLFTMDSLRKTLGSDFPVYKAHKAYPYMNENKEMVVPKEPNAHKYETFVLDMIRMMDSCLPFEVDRKKEFAPIKNLHGVDSVDSARELLKLNKIEL